jgi:hypothetical protein
VSKQIKLEIEKDEKQKVSRQECSGILLEGMTKAAKSFRQDDLCLFTNKNAESSACNSRTLIH